MLPKSPRLFNMRRKNEPLAEKLWRLRGIILVIAVPLALVVLFYGTLARSGTAAAVRAWTTGAGGAGSTYAVVFDAGSTGSRVHVFEFTKANTELVLAKDTFDQLQPGLGDSGWASDPVRAAASLQPLIDKAVATVPAARHAATPIELRATAGLRLLEGSQADDILAAVRELLRGTPFRLADDAVTIMDGADEGAFAWLTLNYLLGRTGRPASELVGALDLGGGSVQSAFAVDADAAARAPEGYIRRMGASGRTYDVYVHSYLNYGLMMGRGAVLARPKANTCMTAGTTGTYKSPYGGKEFSLDAPKGGGSFEECIEVAADALEVGKACGVTARKECSFAGAWGGNPGSRPFYVMSYFFDRAMDAGIIMDQDDRQLETTVGEYARAAEGACSTPLSDVNIFFERVPESGQKFLCLDLSLQSALLMRGLGMALERKITIVKQVQYRGEWYEAAWALGAAINTLAALVDKAE